MNRLLLSGLQLFNEAVQGKKIVYLYRVRSEQAKNDATALAFTTENGRTKSKDADTTATKDGTIRTPGTAEVEITATSILAKGDEDVYKRQTGEGTVFCSTVCGFRGRPAWECF